PRARGGNLRTTHRDPALTRAAARPPASNHRPAPENPSFDPVSRYGPAGRSRQLSSDDGGLFRAVADGPAGGPAPAAQANYLRRCGCEACAPTITSSCTELAHGVS